MDFDPETLCVDEASTVGETVACLDRSHARIALVVDGERRLVGTITDGDVRRALLANVDLSAPVTVLLARKADTPYARPITAGVGMDRNYYLDLLTTHKILHLPLLDAGQRVVGLVALDEFIPDQMLPLQAVVMAGGEGIRLRPLTDDLPKPMLRVGERPLLEIIIEHLRDTGIKRVNVTTHHRPEKISEHFGDGRDFGVEIAYVPEDRPLGTAGGLGLMEAPQETLLVINGDILTQVDFRAMLAYHREQGADLTVAVSQYGLQVPYGVVECEGARVRRVTEKPALRFFVNAGIYLLEPLVHRFIPCGQRFDMTDLIQCLLDDGRSIVSFPIREYWLDIGDLRDYERAQRDANNWRPRTGGA